MGTKLRYKPGSFYRIDERTGFAERAEHTRKQWNNIIVREQSFEERQPQDFVRGRRDDQTVPDPRPRSANVFLGVQTTLTAQSGGGFSGGFSGGFQVGNYVLPVASVVGFNVGDSVSVQMNNGGTFFTTISAISAAALTITLTKPLPYPAVAGAIVT